MEIQQIKGFIAAVRSGSISRAAKLTRRTQPAVSRQIGALETELGAKFFERFGPKKVELTDDGRLFYNLVAPLFEELTKLPSLFDEARKKGGRLVVATHTSVMVFILPNVIKQLSSLFPYVELVVVNRPREGILEMVSSGEANLGITSLATIPSGIEYQPFAKFKRLLLLPSGHPLATKRKLSLKDIADYPLIISPHGSNTRGAIDKAFAAADLTYKVAMEATGRDAVKAYVRMGLGISIINEYYVTSEAKKGLVVRDVSTHFGFAERGVVFRRGKPQSEATRQLICLLKG